jgi:ankyrin repeat protein
VAAATADSDTMVDILINRGAVICSPFTDRHGHVIEVAIRSNALKVLKLLLEQAGLFQAPEIEELLMCIDFEEFRSAEAISILVDKGIDVNTPLNNGTLLLAAASNGWEDAVDRLIAEGAKVNTKAELGYYRSPLEAIIRSKFSASPAIIDLFIRHGAQVNAWDLKHAWIYSKPVGACYTREDRHLERRKKLLLMLIGHLPDLNETWKSLDGEETSALINAVGRGNLDLVQFLIESGADVKLKVKAIYEDALGNAMLSALGRKPQERPYPLQEMIDMLVKEGANLDNLEGDRLHTALAAAASSGHEAMVQLLLCRGASPYASLPGSCVNLRLTALAAAAASTNPGAPAMVHALLNHDPAFKDNYDYFVAARFALTMTLSGFLDGFLSDLFPMPHMQGDIWLQSASALIFNHAVWDLDFTQWSQCLRIRVPEFWRRNADALAVLEERLAQNRTSFFLKFPHAASLQEWKIKDATTIEVCRPSYPSREFALENMAYILSSSRPKMATHEAGQPAVDT